MRGIILIFIIATSLSGGRLGIGLSGGLQKDVNFDYSIYNRISELCYGGEFHLQSEALPRLYLEPLILYFNDGVSLSPNLGVGLRVNVAPRLGRFFIAPFFGIEGDIIFTNTEINLNQAIRDNCVEEYLSSSSPKISGFGFGGISFYLGKSFSIDGQYKYYSMRGRINTEMIWAGLTYYINW
uniref:Uncharacterized protein n=1 Tax=candidate division WOR-3 bacterium TaxID=2052148 RepID=A0A7C4XFJ6_UNCW3